MNKIIVSFKLLIDSDNLYKSIIALHSKSLAIIILTIRRLYEPVSGSVSLGPLFYTKIHRYIPEYNIFLCTDGVPIL